AADAVVVMVKVSPFRQVGSCRGPGWSPPSPGPVLCREAEAGQAPQGCGAAIPYRRSVTGSASVGMPWLRLPVAVPWELGMGSGLARYVPRGLVKARVLRASTHWSKRSSLTSGVCVRALPMSSTIQTYAISVKTYGIRWGARLLRTDEDGVPRGTCQTATVEGPRICQKTEAR